MWLFYIFLNQSYHLIQVEEQDDFPNEYRPIDECDGGMLIRQLTDNIVVKIPFVNH